MRASKLLYPDCTVGAGISPARLALVDFDHR